MSLLERSAAFWHGRPQSSSKCRISTSLPVGCTGILLNIARSAASEAIGEPGSAPFIDSAHQNKVVEMHQMAAQPDIVDQLVQSLAPSIWGMEEVKKGILCQLFGGMRKVWACGHPPC
eukprot:scaffold364204_cov45-Prasinocladus_malaysianus.AAC.1